MTLLDILLWGQQVEFILSQLCLPAPNLVAAGFSKLLERWVNKDVVWMKRARIMRALEYELFSMYNTTLAQLNTFYRYLTVHYKRWALKVTGKSYIQEIIKPGQSESRVSWSHKKDECWE